METQKQNVLALNELTAISFVDGRYGPRTASLRNYLSEYALFKYRTLVELKYFKRLRSTLPQLHDVPLDHLNSFTMLSLFLNISL